MVIRSRWRRVSKTERKGPSGSISRERKKTAAKRKGSVIWSREDAGKKRGGRGRRRRCMAQTAHGGRIPLDREQPL